MIRSAVLVAALLMFAAVSYAQEPTIELDRRLPFATRRILETALGDDRTIAVIGDTVIAAGTTLDGSLAHLGGRLVLEGRVAGDVTAVGSEVVLRPGAAIEGRLTLLGGTLYGTTMAEVRGPTEWLRREPIRVEIVGPAHARVVYEPPSIGFPLEPKGMWGIVVHEYNGVDGLLFGLAAGLKRRPGQPRTELVFGPVFRTARHDVGWDVFFEREFPRAQGLALGGRAYRITDTSERWHRGNTGNSLAALFLADDDRVYYERTGYALWAERTLGLPFRARVEWRDDEFDSLESRQPFAFFGDDEDWRVNPPIEKGRGRAVGGRIVFERRNLPEFATRGVWAEARYDHWGFGGDFEFDWAQVEARGYLPLGPDSSFFGLRAMAGGRLAEGDTLAPQFWYRLGGLSSIPGYDALTIAGDRMAFATATYHLTLPLRTRVFRTLFIVGIASVGDAWFDDDPRANAAWGGGLAGRGATRYAGVFAIYGEETREWQLYFRLRPLF